MSATANEIYRRISDLQNGLIELRAMLSNLEIIDAPDEEELPRTGWRWVRGDTSGTYIKDPNGVDRLPPGYDFTEHHHPDRKRDGKPGYGEGPETIKPHEDDGGW